MLRKEGRQALLDKVARGDQKLTDISTDLTGENESWLPAGGAF